MPIYVQQRSDGSWYASVAELPGCAAHGPTRDGAVAGARAAARDYAAVLRRHGAASEHEVDVDALEVTEAKERRTYPEDFTTMEEHELRDFLHRFEALHAEILALVGSLSQEELEKRPAEKEWSARETLEHIATDNLLYLARLEPWPRGEFGVFKAAHRVIAQRFGVMDAADTQGEHTILGQRYSTKKVARLLLEHEYDHLRQVREAVAAITRK